MLHRPLLRPLLLIFALLASATCGLAQEAPATATAPAVSAAPAPASPAQRSAAAPAAPSAPQAKRSLDVAMAVSHTGDLVQTLHVRLRDVIVSGLKDLSHIGPMVQEMAPESGHYWLSGALLQAVLATAIGLALAFGAGRTLQRFWLRHYPEAPADRTSKVCFLATRGAIGVIQAIIVVATGLLFNDTTNVMGSAQHITVLVAVIATAVTVLILQVARNLIVPDRGAYRMIGLDDADALALWRDTAGMIVLVALMVAVTAWIRGLPLAPDAFTFVYLLQTFLAMVVLITFTLRQRQTIARAILGERPEHDSGIRRIVAYSWHLAAMAYFAVAWLFASARALLGTEGYLGLLTGPVVLIAAGFGLYGLALVLIESVFRNEERGTDEVHGGRPMPSFRRLAEETAAIVVTIVAIAALFQIWGVSPFSMSETIGVRIFTDILIVLLAYLAYQATKIAIDQYLHKEMAHEDPHNLHGASSRLGTLLHLFRGFALISIIVMAVMVGLSDLGINIAPLFAGAGVIGLAVGFGSQTLIKDIFSGAFFLIDDAFRRGEYIDIGSAKGTVEKISIRSVQLRHQNGPLYTVPFGNIHQISNFSRDWVIMKLPIRLAYGTDPEQVRKIVKKIGEEFANDPELGPKFLDSLKSQGVYEMDDSGITFRVKFMTRPGDQFVLRRMVYQRIQEEFEKADIKFAANRSITVRVEAADDIDPETAKKAAVAALPMMLSGPTLADPEAQNAR